jgi:hypothetical protein
MVQVLTLHSNRLTGNVTSLGLCERLHILDLGVSTGGGGGGLGGGWGLLGTLPGRMLAGGKAHRGEGAAREGGGTIQAC